MRESPAMQLCGSGIGKIRALQDTRVNRTQNSLWPPKWLMLHTETDMAVGSLGDASS